MKYTSGPQFLAEHILQNRWVLAVAGTHGKTSTSSMLAWILEDAGYKPGFLIGGVPQNFGVSAALGESDFFVVEADEYDSAFFDKRSKFVHYHPRTLVMNNLEFDHADIFADLAAIQRQFNHLLRTVPGQGKVIYPNDCQALKQVIEMGCWSEQETFSHIANESPWHANKVVADGHQFEVYLAGELQGQLTWSLIGDHNIENAMMAIAAARHVGVPPSVAIDALTRFMPPKRRLECLGEVNGVTVYDDFAHHPTAIATTLAGLRAKVGQGRIFAVLEPRSNTMKSGVHKDTLAGSLTQADAAFLYQADNIDWDIKTAMANAAIPVTVLTDIDAIVTELTQQANAGDTIVVMSNGGFGGIHPKILAALAK